jgi:DNA-binding beta-propeller fold protein YncE
MPRFNPNVPISTTTPTIVVEDMPPGQHRFQLVVEDEAGNRSAPDTRFVTVAQPVPEITSFSPGFGPWGAQVLIQGRNFDPAPSKNRVSFNGVETAVETASPSQLTVRVPQPATTGPIRVLTGNGEAVSRLPFIIPRLSIFGLDAQPSDLDLDGLKNELWITAAANQAGFVLVFSLAAMRLTDRIRLEGIANRIVVSRARERRVCLLASQAAGTATVISLDDRQVAAIIKLRGAPHGIAISPDGHWGYVVCEDDSQRSALIQVIDLAALKRLTEIPVELNSTEVVFGPDGREAFVNNTEKALVTVINVADHKVSDVVKIPGPEVTAPAVAVAGETYPCWTANGAGRSAGAINPAHEVITAKLPLAATTLVVNKKGTLAFLANATEAVLAMARTKDLQQFDVDAVRLPAPALADKSLALTPDEVGLFVLHPSANAVSFYRTEKTDLQAIVPVAEQPTRGLCSGDGKSVCVINQTKQALTVIERQSVLP